MICTLLHTESRVIVGAGRGCGKAVRDEGGSEFATQDRVQQGCLDHDSRNLVVIQTMRKEALEQGVGKNRHASSPLWMNWMNSLVVATLLLA
jgi:hypothetical protein